ncbi:aspartate aminotransferase family protein [Neorhizobium sp. Rsf11]|uniref:Aspartate aminotransferase family protein n=2 Tax=Neorhizobium TaxID=1525371 RepID=A0ABV0M1K1_9HYPH|nr:aspartate aminotransferase family protein [Neorhizobium petrolearium]MCC2609391.1 aspartate aminotransferase family protein [Neorhizobium petrolearium]WGI69605.1 aspartate aminotransferase family protein [Neorhizobium petrolearium]
MPTRTPILQTPPTHISEDLYRRARVVIPDGVNRATVDRDPRPDYVGWGRGAYVHDVDGNGYLDLNNNFTTLIHGHAFEPVVEAVSRTLKDGSCFSNPTVHEINLAELLCERIPAVEQVRFVNTGTEAVMFAIKAARAATGRPAIAKIEGAYHGAYDWAEVGQTGTPENWGSPEAPFSVPCYPGQPRSVTDDVVLLRFNDADGARRRIKAHHEQLACILIDPVPSRAGLLQPDEAFLTAVVETARQYGILVIADEVLNLRQSYSGASARFGLDADLIAMGKIIGGGFPIGAIGGKKTAMAVFDGQGGRPLLPQAGTFSANPVSMVAGFASMRAMTPEQFERLERLGDHLRTRLRQVIAKYEAPFSVTGSASLFRLHPRLQAPREYREAYLSRNEADTMRQLGRHFKKHGIILPFGAAASLSTAMGDTEIELIVDAFEKALVCEELAA